MATPDEIRRLRRGLVLGIVAALIAAVAFSTPAAAGPTPKPTPATQQHVTRNGQLPTHLPISLDLLGITITLDVPLTVDALLHPSTSATSSAAPQPSSKPPTTHHPTATHTRHRAAPSSTTSIRTVAQAVPPPTNHTTTHPHTAPTHQRTTPHRTTPHRTTQPTQQPKSGVIQEAGTALLNLLPTSFARLMYLLIFLVGAGIALGVVRMGRRDRRHAR